MTIAWISISTRWSLTSVQASLNVIISVLATIGVWAFSRYWWQRGSQKVLRGTSDVPLSSLVTLSSPGEGWDAAFVLRKRMFAKENWWLLFQLLVIAAVTAVCMLAGPVAKASLRSTYTAQLSKLGVLQAVKGDSFLANRVSANVQWNDTMQSLNQAGFPYDQVLDYLPPATAPWMYKPREWPRAWSASCKQYDETLISLTASGNATWAHPLDAFPKYRDTYDSSWLDQSRNRFQADFAKEWSYQNDQEVLIKDAIFWVLIQSDPAVDGRMYSNAATLQLSISAVHARNFRCRTYDDSTQAGLDNWRPIGPVENASYSRVECNISRNADSGVLADDVPWIWTNDTHSITNAYRTYWATEVGEKSSKNLTVAAPTPQEIMRFYQAYMISVNTWLSRPSTRSVSVWKDTVQLHSTLLVVLILLAALELWLAIRYFWFLRRNKLGLKSACVPDGKLEWMIHAAKLASQDEEDARNEITKAKDRDFLRRASFGNVSDVSIRPMELARVYTNRGSVSGRSRNGALSKKSPQECSRPMISISNEDSTQEGFELQRTSSSIGSYSGITVSSEQQCCTCSKNNLLSPPLSRTSSAGRSRSSTLHSDAARSDDMRRLTASSASSLSCRQSDAASSRTGAEPSLATQHNALGKRAHV